MLLLVCSVCVYAVTGWAQPTIIDLLRLHLPHYAVTAARMTLCNTLGMASLYPMLWAWRLLLDSRSESGSGRSIHLQRGDECVVSNRKDSSRGRGGGGGTMMGAYGGLLAITIVDMLSGLLLNTGQTRVASSIFVVLYSCKKQCSVLFFLSDIWSNL